MDRKRIVIVHNWIAVGINIQSCQLAKELSKEYDVWFLTGARADSAHFAVNEHLTVIQWPNKRPTRLKDFWFCYQLFRRVKPDVVMAHFTGIRLSMIAAWLTGVKSRIAWYHIISGALRGIKTSKWGERIMIGKYKLGYLFANYIVAFHEYGKVDASRFLGKRLDRIFTIPNGLALVSRENKGIGTNSNGPVFLFLGRLDITKGCDIIIRCFKKVYEKNPGARLLIVGDGDQRESWLLLIESLQLQEVIKMPGRTETYEGVFDYLQQAYALLVPSRIDNFPTVIIEAFAASVPVIASDAGGIPNMIRDGVDGFICELPNEEAWVEKMERLIEDVNLRNSMSVEARKSYEEKFTLHQHVQNVRDLLGSLCKN